MGIGDAYLAEELRDIFQLIRETHQHVVMIGAGMATTLEQLTALKAQIADTTSDVLAKLQQLNDQLGTLDPEAQVTLDEITAGVQSLDDAVGDADGSEGTPEPEPVPVP